MMIEATSMPDAPAISTGPTTGRIPGNKGMWVGITCEFVEFSLMFLVYFVSRMNYPEAFKKGPEAIWTTAGAVNTVLMVTSSFFIACSVAAMRAGSMQRSRRWLVAAIVTALGYPVMKFYEIGWNLAHGIDGSAGIFYTVYYYLTFNHLVHACWGIGGMLWVLARMSANAYSAKQHDGLEALACYWHATDIIWLMIFSLFYVLA
jgi:cytochrome c oxidase subunit III